MVRRLARTASLTKFPVEIHRENGGFRAVVETADSRGEFLTDVNGEIALLDPHGHASKVALTPTAPGRLEGWWPAPERGAYNAEVVLRHGATDEDPIARQFISATVGYPDEFLLKGINEPLLRRLAAETGGLYNPAPADLFKDDHRTAGVESELWPWLLGLAAFLFVFDVAVKRWPERDVSARKVGMALRAVP